MTTGFLTRRGLCLVLTQISFGTLIQFGLGTSLKFKIIDDYYPTSSWTSIIRKNNENDLDIKYVVVNHKLRIFKTLVVNFIHLQIRQRRNFTTKILQRIGYSIYGGLFYIALWQNKSIRIWEMERVANEDYAVLLSTLRIIIIIRLFKEIDKIYKGVSIEITHMSFLERENFQTFFQQR